MERSLKGKFLAVFLAITLVTGLSPTAAFALELSAGESLELMGQNATTAADEDAESAEDSEAPQATRSYDANPWEGGTCEGSLTLDTPIEVTTDSEGVFYSFTPTESGTYRFYTESDVDTVGGLHEMNGSEIAYNDDYNGDHDFNFSLSLEAGSTYYLHARMYSGNGTFKLVVTDKRDFTQVYYYLVGGKTEYAYEEGEVCNPLERVYYYDDEGDEVDLNEGDYTVSYLDSYDNECDPEEPGSYQMVLTGQGEWSGTKTCWFTIVDYYDLNNASLELLNDAVAYQVDAVRMPAFAFTQYREGEWRDVPESGYTAAVVQWDSGAGEYIPVEAQAIGQSYTLVVEPVSPYYGESRYADFTIVSPTDLAAADIQIEKCYSYDSETIVHPEVTVTFDGEELTEGTDYESTWSYYSWETGEYEIVEGPSNTWTGYTFTIRGVEGSDYEGTSKSVNYSLDAATDISYASFEYETNTYEWTDEPVDLQVRVSYDGEELVEGEDYEISYGNTDTEQDLDGVPAAAGNYVAVFSGKGRFYGSWYYYFSIVDPYDLAKNAEAWVYYSDRFYIGEMPDDFEVIVELHDQDWNYRCLDKSEFVVEGYERLADGVWVAATDFNVAGRYHAVITGANPYHGTTYADFTVYDPNGLESASISYNNTLAVLGDAKITPEWSVHLNGEYLTEGTHYTVAYFINDDSGTPVEAPLGVGNYYAVFSACDGSDYSGTYEFYFAVYDDGDLANASFSLSSTSYAATGNPVDLDVNYVRSYSGTKLVLGTDYVFVYKDSAGTELDGAPTDLGTYRVTIAAVEGGKYTGKYDSWKRFRIVDPYDLSNASFELKKYVYAETGGPVQLELDYASSWGGKTLVQGVDFEFYFEDNDEQLLDEAPSEIGSYYVGIKAKDGSDYTGQTEAEECISIVASNDLAAGKFSLGTSRYAVTSEPVVLDVECAQAADGTNLKLGEDYEFAYYYDDDEWEELSGAPSEPGEYLVSIKAVEGGTYIGESSSSYFEIYDPYDLSDGEFFWASASDFYAGDMPDDFGVRVYNEQDDSRLIENEQYTAVIQRESDEGWVDVDNFDGTVVGEYRFVVTGVNPYHGTRRVSFDVLDPSDLSNADAYSDSVYVRGSSATGTPAWNVEINDVKLVEGTHFTVTYYTGSNKAKVVEAPLLAGKYYAELVAVDGSGYIGRTHSWAYVYDACELSNASFRFSSESYVVTGSPVVPTIKYARAADGVDLVEGVDYEFFYEEEVYDEDDDDYYYEELDSAPSKPGYYRVRLKPADGSSYTGVSNTRWFSIIDPKDLSNAGFDLDRYAYAYTGQAIEPVLDSAWTWDGKTLTKGTHFEFYYEDSNEEPLDGAPSAIGSYYVGLKAKDGSGYTGASDTSWFQIVAPNDLALASVSIDSYQHVYTGQAINPAITVVMGSKTLAAGTDYDVAYYEDEEEDGIPIAAPIATGYYDIRITGKGDYTGTCYSEFRIVAPNDLSAATISGMSSEYTYTGQAIAPKPEVYDVSGNKLVEGTHFEYRYWAYDEDWGEDYSVDPSQCVDVGTYWVSASAIDGGGYTGSKWQRYRIVEGQSGTPINISGAVVTAASQVYSGVAQTPAVTVTLNGAAIPASGYTVAYANNENAGTASITVTGTGDYTGTATGTFAIARKAVTVTANDASKTFGANDPLLTATVAGTLGADTVEYSLVRVSGEDVRAGGYDIQAMGDSEQGNYAVTFVNGILTINPLAITIGITGQSATVAYDGQEHAVSGFTVSIPDGVALTADNVVYGDATAPEAKGTEIGTYNMDLDASKFALSGSNAGNYDATFDVTDGSLTIHNVDIKGIDVPAAANLTYNGTEQEGVATSEQYAITDGVATATNAGSYTVTLTANEGYVFPTGETATVTWSIAPKSVTVTANNASKTYGTSDPALTAVADGTLGTDTVAYTVVRAVGENAGTYAIVASGEAIQGNYKVTFANGTFTISRAPVTVKAIDASKTYGAADPKFNVDIQGLVGDDSISVGLSRASGENVGTYAITASGDAVQGNYDVTFASGTFTISARSIASGAVSGLAAKTYTGGAITQSPALTVNGKKLALNTDYTVSYKNNVNAGTATVTFTGKGNYTGAKTATFAINKASQAISSKTKITKTFKGEKLVKNGKLAKKQTIDVKKLSQAAAKTPVKYKLTVPKKAKKAKKYLKINTTTGKITVKKGLPKGKYTVKVTMSAAANANFNAAPNKTIKVVITVK